MKVYIPEVNRCPSRIIGMVHDEEQMNQLLKNCDVQLKILLPVCSDEQEDLSFICNDHLPKVKRRTSGSDSLPPLKI